MRVLGIDPGLQKLGWGIIDSNGSRLTHVANGVCKSQGSDLSKRLVSLFEDLNFIIKKYKPERAAIEKTFVNKDGENSIKLGQARGVAMLAPALAGLEIGEYAPNTIKKSVVGVGHANKKQVEAMVKLQLPKVEVSGADAADALAIAMCHAFFLGRKSKIVSSVK